MDQSYLNCPCSAAALSAEEFAASLARSGQSGQRGQARVGGGRDAELVCSCRSVRLPDPEPLQVDEGCCCKQSFRAALGLLCGEELSSLLDFDQAAFLTDSYVAGATLTETIDPTGPADNLLTLDGSFRRFTPCSCDLLDISAALVSPPAVSTGLTATQVSVCQLTAVVIGLAETTAEGDLTAEEVAARNFRRVKRLLAQRLDPCAVCQEDSCAFGDCQDCCCSSGLLSTLARGNLSRQVSLSAGPLLLVGVTLLGAAGSVLVLANDADQRIYFVCVNDVQFLI